MEFLIVIAVLGIIVWWVLFREPATPDTSLAPYKVETPVASLEPVAEPKSEPVTMAFPTVVNDQITDAVTQEAPPAKKPRKPRTPKVQAVELKVAPKKAVVKKATTVKAVAMKAPTKRSKKA